MFIQGCRLPGKNRLFGIMLILVILTLWAESYDGEIGSASLDVGL